MSAPPPIVADADAFGGADFAQLLAAFAPFEHRPDLAVAVSGGADSMALAILARDWVEARGGSVLGLVVDHALRPRSSAEARATVERLATLRIVAEPLIWAGPKPFTGLQAAARAARLGLLSAACRRRGILHLLLGHHRADQAETVAMRAAAGSGPNGLAGMAAVVERDGVRLLRPLLTIGRGRLEALLRAEGVAWIDDASNADRRFARGRLRADPSFATGPWAELGRERAAARAKQDDAVARFLARSGHLHPLGFARLDTAAFDAQDAALRQAVLGHLLRAIGGAAFPPSAASLRRLLGATGTRRSLGGCLVRGARGCLEITREPARVRAVVLLGPFDSIDWDRRWHLVAGALDDLIEVRPLGHDAVLLPRPVRRDLAARRVPASALAALPSLWRGASFLGCPALPGDPDAGPVEVTATLRMSPPVVPGAHAGPIVVSNHAPLIYPATLR